MSPDLSTAFVVLLVGMTTVFVILGLVVLTGTGLIRLVNHFSPMPAVESFSEKSNQAIPKQNIAKEQISKSKLAAIVAAVDKVSGGKAQIKNIKKIK